VVQFVDLCSASSFNMISSIKQLSPILVILAWVTLLQAQRNEFQREVEAPLKCVPAEQSRNGDTIMVTYRGFLADGKVFDSNQGKDPISFKLGAGKVIKGWERGLAKTCPGEQVVMIIPPELGYGEKGAGGGVIPGGATLYFITTLDGLVRTTREGTEKENGKCKELKTIQKGDSVTMTSTVSLMTSSKDGNIVPGSRIDTSTDTIKLGDGQLIKGWELGITGACQGEERRLVLGPSLAWGENGFGDRVPANASVVIDVKIENVERDLVFNFLNQISSGTFRKG